MSLPLTLPVCIRVCILYVDLCCGRCRPFEGGSGGGRAWGGGAYWGVSVVGVGGVEEGLVVF